MSVSRQSVARQSNADPARVLLLITGSVVLLLGAIMLVSLALVAVDVVRNPAEVALIALLMQSMEQSGVALAGHLGEIDFALRIEEPLRTLLFLVVCVWVLGALASILKTIVLTGKALVERAGAGRKD